MSARHKPFFNLSFAFAGLCLMLSAIPAGAQPTAEQQKALRSNCRSDFMSNCSGVSPGGAEALQCLQRNVAKLSPGCQGAVNALAPRSAPQPATASAPPPAATPAPAPAPAPASAPAAASAPPPAARTAIAPTTAHPSKPSTAAAPAKPTAQQQAAIRQSCQGDFMSRCSGVQPGGSAALQCLQRNAARLSPNCKRAVAALGRGAPAARMPAPAAAPVAAEAAGPAPTAEQLSAIKFTCRSDFRANCRGVPQGGPEALACLQRNAPRLSQNCRTSLAAVADEAPAAGAVPAAAIETMPSECGSSPSAVA
jgi:hypothetical protein